MKQKLVVIGNGMAPGRALEHLFERALMGALADPVTRTFQIRLALDAGVTLPLGSTVTVVPQSLSAKGLEAIKLPTSALMHDKGGSAVWVLDPASMTLRAQPVEILVADGNEAVIVDGLNPGEEVVATGVHVLSPGQPVVRFATPSQ